VKTKKPTRSSIKCPRCQFTLARLEAQPGTYECQHCGITYLQTNGELRAINEQQVNDKR
jgi:ribosomal protein L37AE/L43A